MEDSEATILSGPGWDKQTEEGKRLLREDMWWLVNFFLPAVQAMKHNWDGTFNRIHESYLETTTKDKSKCDH